MLKPQRKANPEILKHQQKKEIQIHLLQMRRKLESQGFLNLININFFNEVLKKFRIPQEEIEDRVKKAEEIMNEKMEKNEFLVTKF